MTVVLVTGSAGFIGRHLVRCLLARGFEVHGFDRHATGWTAPGYTEHTGNLLDPTALPLALRASGAGAVIHLAARTDLDERAGVRGYAANTVGVDHLARAIAGAPGVERVICTSSQLVCRLGYRPRHDHDYLPATAYGRSKVETERRWRTADGAGRTWCIVRPTTIWGPGMNPHYLRFFELLRAGRYVHVAGGPTLKSYGYVGNTVEQYARLLEAPADRVHRRVFYLADDPPLELERWVEAFREALGAPPVRTVPRGVAQAVARVGDGLVALGFRRFPFTSFRLANVTTPAVVDTTATREVCGPGPVGMADAVAATAAWLRRVWAGADRWAID
ncbi:MAG: NAD-dependent epimerase/dehydratase family protein [Gemmatimonadota bacterium]